MQSAYAVRQCRANPDDGQNDKHGGGKGWWCRPAREGYTWGQAVRSDAFRRCSLGIVGCCAKVRRSLWTVMMTSRMTGTWYRDTSNVYIPHLLRNKAALQIIWALANETTLLEIGNDHETIATPRTPRGLDGAKEKSRRAAKIWPGCSLVCCGGQNWGYSRGQLGGVDFR